MILSWYMEFGDMCDSSVDSRVDESWAYTNDLVMMGFSWSGYAHHSCRSCRHCCLSILLNQLLAQNVNQQAVDYKAVYLVCFFKIV